MAIYPPHDSAATFYRQRQTMVESQLECRGIHNQALLEAFRRVPRHAFVPPTYQAQAYNDHPLPIGSEQTISQPYVVAYMLQILELTPEDRVLEIGTGSGYQTALLAALVDAVYSIEFFPTLAARAQQLLSAQGYTNICYRVGDGAHGWPEAAPFNAIIGSAAAPQIPAPLIDQLALDGRLILPVGTRRQQLVRIKRTGTGIHQEALLPVRFVPFQRL